MSISTQIPSSWRLPLFWGVVDGSMAGNINESQPALLVGQAFLSGAASATLKGGATGNGTIAMDPQLPVASGSRLGVYKVVFSSATAFTVTGPNAAAVGTGVVGTKFANQVSFTIAAGSTPFVATDEFDITVTSLPLGSARPNVPVPVGTAAIAALYFGAGSMLERMFARFFANNTTQQVWCLPVLDPAAGQPATASIALSVGALQSGVLTVYIAGQRVQVSVFSTDTAASVATNLAAAINAMATLPMTATASAGVVSLTARWKGQTGNDIDIRLNYLGINGGEQTPVGLSVAITAAAGGAGQPDFSAAIASIQAAAFYNVALPYDDTGSLQAWDAEYGFGPGGRWAYTRQQYGWIYNAHRDTYSGGLVWGLAHNSSVTSTLVVETGSPSPVWEWVAAYCGRGAAALLDDPARPLQSLELIGILTAPVHQRFAQTELNDLTNSGLAVQGAAPSGNPMILRESLQYQFNSYGQSDTAFALITVLSNLAELLTRFKAAITTKYPRHKLAPDGTNFGPGQAIVTPTILKAEIIVEARQAEYDGLMANITAFKQNLLVEIDSTNPNRVNVLWPPQLMGQLRDFDVLAQFRLQAQIPTS